MCVHINLLVYTICVCVVKSLSRKRVKLQSWSFTHTHRGFRLPSYSLSKRWYLYWWWWWRGGFLRLLLPIILLWRSLPAATWVSYQFKLHSQIQSPKEVQLKEWNEKQKVSKFHLWATEVHDKQTFLALTRNYYVMQEFFMWCKKLYVQQDHKFCTVHSCRTQLRIILKSTSELSDLLVLYDE